MLSGKWLISFTTGKNVKESLLEGAEVLSFVVRNLKVKRGHSVLYRRYSCHWSTYVWVLFVLAHILTIQHIVTIPPQEIEGPWANLKIRDCTATLKITDLTPDLNPIPMTTPMRTRMSRDLFCYLFWRILYRVRVMFSRSEQNHYKKTKIHILVLRI